MELKVTRLVMYGNRARAHFDELAQFWREKLEVSGRVEMSVVEIADVIENILFSRSKVLEN